MISKRPHYFTSESVTEGHPDKMADQISDAILDAAIERDPKSRVAVECMLKTGLCLIAGEVTTKAQINFNKIARKTISDIGYTSCKYGFDSESCSVIMALEEQSPDIALGVNETTDKALGAGDQGLMFGFACDETPELMPLSISYAHKLSMRLAEVRKSNIIPFLGPDGKTQVTVFYENQRPKFVSDVLVSTQHASDVSIEIVREAVYEEVIKKVLKKNHMGKDIKYHINPTGKFVIGGPMGDSGLTGRKIIVDTYGGMGRHGGGAFSGKDPTKVDRTAAYMARCIAKNVVAADLARRCEVQLAYAIGVSEPISVMVNTFDTAKVSEEQIENSIKTLFPLDPQGMIEYLHLLRPIYKNTASYGHFGRTHEDFAWENVNMSMKLRELIY